jgi:hypothetical protein
LGHVVALIRNHVQRLGKRKYVVPGALPDGVIGDIFLRSAASGTQRKTYD